MSNPTQQIKTLGPYQSLYQDALNQKDYQTALKYIIQYTHEKPEQDKLWNFEIISCSLALNHYNYCIKRVTENLKTAARNDYINHFEVLAKCYIGLFNKEKAFDCIKEMEQNFRKQSNESKEEGFVETISQKISDLKAKIDIMQDIPEEKRKDEAKQYKQLEEKEENQNVFKKEGEEVYLIPTQWLNKWKEYSLYNELFEQSDSMEDENEIKKSFDQLYPGPIDASVLIEPYVKNQILDPNEDNFIENYVLKKEKQEKHDFEIICKEIADFLYSRYGGYKVKRMTIMNPVTNEVNVELFFKKINFIPIPTISPKQDKDTLYTLYISKFASPEQLNLKIKRILYIIPQLNQAIWNRQYYKYWKVSPDILKNYQNIYKTFADKYREKEIMLNVSEIVVAQDETIEDIQLGENDIIVYELSQYGDFKIKASPLIKKQSSKMEQESTKDTNSSKLTPTNQSSNKMLDESEEQEQENDTFPTGKIKQRPYNQTHIRNMMSKFKIQGNQKGFSGKKGLTGLQNIGNTCFMNSSLQCLSNIEELTTFMVNNEYVNDLNPDNPLGASGYLAVSYADLVRDMWQENNSSVSPHYLKKVIGKFAPQFYGYSQQDSQELLSYLLDGIHEDLNRIKKKPIVEAIDYSGGKDDEMSLQFFKNYKKRNDSVISDLMVGQFKSTLVCPDKKCGKISITFDPFLTLSVPIPRITKEEIKFYVLFKDARKIPLKIEYQVRSDSRIEELKEIISDNLNIPAQCLVFANNSQQLIEEFIDDNQRAVHLNEISGIGFVYEVERQATSINVIVKNNSQMEEENQDKQQNLKKKSPRVLQNDGDQEELEEEEEEKDSQEKSSQTESNNIQYVFAEVEMTQIKSSYIKLSDDNISNSNIHNISFSRLISISKDSTIQDLYIEIYRIMRVYFNSYKQNNDVEPEIKVNIQINDDSKEQLEKEIQEFQNLYDKKIFRIFNKDMTPINYDNKDNILSLRYKTNSRLHIKVILDESIESKLMRTKRCESQSFTNQKNSKELSQKGINLYDCLDQFVMKEQLEKGNEWFCNKCKKHVLATKQMEIYQTPKILIIHLKRFKSGNVSSFGKQFFQTGGKKINDLIDFPIENLNMTKYVLGTNGRIQIYDLFAVSQHYGGMGGGHYTACAKNFINNRWFNFNDSHVSQTTPERAVSNEAYVLFYRRKD